MSAHDELVQELRRQPTIFRGDPQDVDLKAQNLLRNDMRKVDLRKAVERCAAERHCSHEEAVIGAIPEALGR